MQMNQDSNVSGSPKSSYSRSTKKTKRYRDVDEEILFCDEKLTKKMRGWIEILPPDEKKDVKENGLEWEDFEEEIIANQEFGTSRTFKSVAIDLCDHSTQDGTISFEF